MCHMWDMDGDPAGLNWRKPMQKFIMIDNCSGFVWGEARADSPAQAVATLMTGLGQDGAGFEKPRPDSSDESGYFVYDGTGFDMMAHGDGDGQSEELIEAVSKLSLVAYFELKSVS